MAGTPMIEIDEVQPIVLQTPAPDQMHLTLTFLRFGGDVPLARLRLQSVLRSVAAIHRSTRTARPNLNLGLTAAALRLLDVDQRTRDALPGEFTAGMRAAAPRLRDPESVVREWVKPFDTEIQVHAVVVLASEPGDEAAAPLDGIVAAVDADDVVATWHGQRAADGREPFGFVDNISDPCIEGSGRTVTPGNGIWDPDLRRWREVRSGEAVLGYADESGTIAGHPDAARLLRNGSYLVLRRLEQHVEQFEQVCNELAGELGIAPDDVAAQMMGRHKDGRPLGYEDTSSRFNDFLYREGGRRSAIPPSAHIRRANPRDDVDFAEKIINRHQLFRRGYPYQDGSTKGLLFLACCADIRRQFEFVQAQWLQHGNRFGLGAERDPITGQLPDPSEGDASGSPPPTRTVSFDDHGRRRRIDGLGSYVTTRGGEYFFLPGLSAMELLADGRISQRGSR